MSWKDISSLARRLQFVKLALKAQRGMSQLCHSFRISRRVGYKWRRRFEREGLRGLRDRSRRPLHSPKQISTEWLGRIRRLRRRYRTWGSKKLRARLLKEYPREQVPSVRTITKWLRRMKLSRRRRYRPAGPQLRRPHLTSARSCNEVWTVDFKGWFRTADGQRVEPLTVRDMFSRYLLRVRVLPDQTWRPVQRVFIGLFGQNGYPKIIRVDNGMPFGSIGPAGLSRLSAWWRALGIVVEFTAPGHPEHNGAHEQMHRVLKAETTHPPSANRRAQQRRMNRWVRIYNHIRPHQGLAQRAPAELYQPSRSRSRAVQLNYPSRWSIRRVRSNGEVRWRGRKRFIGEAFVGYPVGLQPAVEAVWRVFFGNLLIGELHELDEGGMRPVKVARRF
jgi:putative transposase